MCAISFLELLTGLCDELCSIMFRFWWVTSNGNRKMACIRWSNICLPKAMGGLGFRDLQLFNQALIVKQAWRIIRDTSLLTSRILNGKYFHNICFLNASDKGDSSYLWGKEVILKGIRLKV